MRLVKIGVASVNTTVGAFRSNVDRAVEVAEAMAAEEVTLGAFQEQVVSGYPAQDLVLWRSFVEQQWTELMRFADLTAGLATAFVVGLTVAVQGLRYNSAAVVAGGRVLGLVPKQKLPTYSVFYEARTFSRGIPGRVETCHGVPFGDYLFAFDFGPVAVEICEDIWSADGPMRRRAYAGAEIVVNISASPFRVDVVKTRREMIATRAADNQCTVVYANAVGGNDGLIFDGGGYVNQNGRELLDARRFRQGFAAVVLDLDRTSRLRAENTTWRSDREDFMRSGEPLPHMLDVDIDRWAAGRNRLRYPVPAHASFHIPVTAAARPAGEALCEDVLDALALGVGDYFEKTGVFRCIGLALSGGRDSALTLLIAHRWAIRSGRDPSTLIHSFYMPTRFSSQETRRAAEALAGELGVRFEVVPIEEAFAREIEDGQKMLAPGEPLTEVTRQNIQARLRALRMWSWANSSDGLYLQTGNMSEKAVGYTTVGGDLTGGLSVIANVPKTMVTYLLQHLRKEHGYCGIDLVLARPAGPELATDQRGEEELMPFPVLDACLHLFAGEKLAPPEIAAVLATMFPDIQSDVIDAHVRRFVRLFLGSIYKCVQAPISLHIGNLDLERERALQLPVVSSGEWVGRDAGT
jgi:NAD+ synthase (glutamine-hydrolysing)